MSVSENPELPELPTGFEICVYARKQILYHLSTN